jgi:acetyl-CoA carboxylase biotin carboxyl carrier protein
VTFKEILELIEKVAQHGIGAVEIEHAGMRVRIEGKAAAPQMMPSSMPAQHGGEAPGTQQFGSAPAAPALPAPAPAAPPPAADADAGLYIITSPIVGTFYRSPNPEADSFVNVGDRISKGKVLCIVEAMKLMNEIESDVDGVIVSIYPQNGQPIEYGEKLFAVRL